MKGKLFTTILLAIAVLAMPAFAEDAKKAPAKETEAKGMKISTKILKAGGEPKYELKSKYIPGKYLMDMLIETDMQMGSTPDPSSSQPAMPMQNIKTDMAMSIEMVVGKYDDKGIKEITVQYTSFKMTNPMLGEISVTREQAVKEAASTQPAKSAAAPQDMIKQMYSGFMLAKIVIKIDRDEKVVSVTGMDEMIDGANVPPMMKPMMKKMKKSLGDQMMNGFVEAGKAYFPDKPVGVGAEWINTVKMPFPMLGDIDTDTKIVFDSVKETPEGKIAVLKTEMAMTMGKDIKSENPMVNMSKFKSNMAGVSKFNIEKGMIQEDVQEGTTDMTMQAGPQGEMNMVQKIKTTMTIKTVK